VACEVRAIYRDDVNRIERRAESAIGRERASTNGETIFGNSKRAGKTGCDRLAGSAASRLSSDWLGIIAGRWELDKNPRWKRDPTFYIAQTLTALVEALTVPHRTMRRGVARFSRALKILRQSCSKGQRT